MITEIKTFYKKLLMKTFSLFGFTFFSVLVGLQIAGISQMLPILYSSFIGSGLYFFTELMKYYKLQPNSKVTSNSKAKQYHFLI